MSGRIKAEVHSCSDGPVVVVFGSRFRLCFQMEPARCVVAALAGVVSVLHSVK